MWKLVIVLVLSVPALARAQCAEATFCVCQAQQPTIVVGHVTAIDGSTATVAVDQALVVVDGGAAPSTMTIASQSSDQVGEKVIVGIDPPSEPYRVTVGEGDTISCSTTPSSIPLAKAVDALKSSDCNGSLHEAGFAEPACNDSPGCGSVGPSFAALALCAAVGLLALRRART